MSGCFDEPALLRGLTWRLEPSNAAFCGVIHGLFRCKRSCFRVLSVVLRGATQGDFGCEDRLFSCWKSDVLLHILPLYAYKSLIVSGLMLHTFPCVFPVNWLAAYGRGPSESIKLNHNVSVFGGNVAVCHFCSCCFSAAAVARLLYIIIRWHLSSRYYVRQRLLHGRFT